MKEEICGICKKDLKDEDGGGYEYRGFLFCEPHFDEGIERVDRKRGEVMEVTNASLKSQAGGEWMNGGYKTMKTDVSGSPIPSRIKEPQILKDYENGIL